MNLLEYNNCVCYNGDPLYHLIGGAGYHGTEKILEFWESLYQDGDFPYVIQDEHQHNLIFSYVY